MPEQLDGRDSMENGKRRGGLEPIFQPGSIAVVGASDQPGSVGGAVLTNLKSAGFRGPLFAINHKHGVIQGKRAFRALTELPQVPDLVVVCTPAPTVPQLIRDCGQIGAGGMIVISAGFREAGPAGKQLETDLQSARREFPQLRFIGPNCLGVLRTANRLNASFSPVMPREGRITFLSQSGALCTAILDWAIEREIGFASCVSTGNMADVGMGDLIDYFAQDDQTDALLLYIEGLQDTEHFLAAARRCSRHKPIIAYKAGRFAESSAAAASHTGAIASVDAVYDVAFRHAAIERVNSIEELFDCARLLKGRIAASGNRLAILTNAGGPGVMATDAWLALGGSLAKLSHETIEALNSSLPSCWSHGNPIDILGDASTDRFQSAIRLTLADENVDALLVILTPQTMTEPTRVAEALAAIKRGTEKPIVASWIGGPAVQDARSILRDASIPVYDFPEQAVVVLHHLISSGQRRQSILHDRPVPKSSIEMPLRSETGTPPHDRQIYWQQVLSETNGLLGEVRSKQLLADYGVPVVTTSIAQSAEEAAFLADQQGYPVVIKILSKDISHKTDVGGVILNIANADGVRNSFNSMMSVVRKRCPTAVIDGVAVQRMVSTTRGVELLLGMTRDPQFGPVLLLGAGGVTAELQKDSVLEIAPFDEESIDRMFRSLRLFPLLEGYRGRPGVNLGQLHSAVAQFAKLVQELPELATAEINPLLADANHVIALDARIISGGHCDNELINDQDTGRVRPLPVADGGCP